MDFLSPTLPWIEAVQRLTFLDLPFRFASFLGGETFFLLLLPFLYWCVGRGIGARLGLMILASVLVNHLLKISFAAPRPYWIDPSLERAVEHSFGFPSGHAQNAALVWTFLALQTRNRRLWVPLALVLALFISLSRLYLGVHFPADAFGGALVGFGLLGLFGWIQPRLLSRWHELPTLRVALLAGVFCLITLVLAVLLPRTSTLPQALEAVAPRDAFSSAGAFFGLSLGLALARPLKFVPPPSWARRLMFFALGMVGVAFLYGATKLVGGENLPWRFVRYALTTLWVAWGALWLFDKVEGGKQKVASS